MKQPLSNRRARAEGLRVALLTGGDDRPYALGMALCLAAEGILVDFIGSDKLDAEELRRSPHIHFINLRGDQSEETPFFRKAIRILYYYIRLLWFSLTTRSTIFHILWNNRFEVFDRTAVMLFYRLLGKRIVLTAHNVNARKRDNIDNWVNRLSLRIQYMLSHHLLVHTAAMKSELAADFGVAAERVHVIPFGINNTTPQTTMTSAEARVHFGLNHRDQVLLFFGQIAPYKGLEYLVSAMSELIGEWPRLRLIVAGRIKPGYERYWEAIRAQIAEARLEEQILQRIRFVPDDEVERYFKAADVTVIPYVDIFQSGVPYLSYSFGVPVIATTVGSLASDVIEGETGFLSRSKDSAALAGAIRRYLGSDLYKDLPSRRPAVRRWANERNSWTKVGTVTAGVYRLLNLDPGWRHYAECSQSENIREEVASKPSPLA